MGQGPRIQYGSTPGPGTHGIRSRHPYLHRRPLARKEVNISLRRRLARMDNIRLPQPSGQPAFRLRPHLYPAGREEPAPGVRPCLTGQLDSPPVAQPPHPRASISKPEIFFRRGELFATGSVIESEYCFSLRCEQADYRSPRYVGSFTPAPKSGFSFFKARTLRRISAPQPLATAANRCTLKAQ